MQKIFFTIIVQFIFLHCSFATVFLPAIFSNHLVLQQNTAVKIWGWSETEEKITINEDHSGVYALTIDMGGMIVQSHHPI